MNFDPITFQLIRSAIDSIADEMALTVVRTAFSTVVRDNMDFSTGFCNKDGELVAQGLTIPVHLGTIPGAMGAVLREFGADLRPGDVYCMNDPFDGGIHLPDVFVFKPIFHRGRLAGFAASICHHTDVGGRVPGSNASDSTEIYQEGLRIPPLRLLEEGRPNATLFKLIEKNVRVPVKVLGDLRAQIATCHLGEARFLALLDKYGFDTVDGCLTELIIYAERLTRAEIAALPDGTFDFTDHIDDDGIDDRPIRLHVSIRKQGDHMTVDLTGTSPQVKGAINSPIYFTRSSVYLCVRSLLSQDIPNNAGMFRPIEVIAPEGTVLNPKLPAAVAARGLTAFRLADAVFGALAKMAPDRVFAASDGGNTGISIGGYHDNGEPYIYVEFLCNAWGGRPDKDGPEGVTSLTGNLANTPVEVIEAEYPLRVDQYALAADTAGPGRFRGGVGCVRDLRFLGKEAVLQVRSDRRHFRPFGLAGGGPGAPSASILNPDAEAQPLASKVTMTLRHGDVFRHVTPGAGGWGDPLRRDPRQVAADVAAAKVTVASAAEQYGVVIDPATGEVDEHATAERRQRRRGGQEA